MSRRKKKQTKVMKIKDPNTSVDSRYALKRHRTKKGVFSANSPFNESNHGRSTIIEDEHTVGKFNDGRVDRMIETNRGVTDEQLDKKQQVDDSAEETV